MNQKKKEEIELHLCKRLKKLPFQNRSQLDFVFKFASLIVRQKKVGFYVIDDTIKGQFCDKSLELANSLEKLKTYMSFDDLEKVKEILNLQREIEEKMDILIKKTKEIK
jgi:hypothetical protein